MPPLKLWVRTPFMARYTRYNIVIKFVSDLQQAGVFSGYSGFLHQQNWPPRYNWNILESGVKHHKPWKFRNTNITQKLNWIPSNHILLDQTCLLHIAKLYEALSPPRNVVGEVDSTQSTNIYSGHFMPQNYFEKKTNSYKVNIFYTSQ